MTVKEAQRRLAEKGRPLDQLEKNRDRQEQVRAFFLALANDERFGRVIVIDNMRPTGEAAEEIFQEILKII